MSEDEWDERIGEARHGGRRYQIIPDRPEVGVYLYVFEDDRCVADYLQDNLEACLEQATEDFGVPAGAWAWRTQS